MTVVIEAKPQSKKKKSSHKSPKKISKAGFQTDLKSLDDKWSAHFDWLEAMFLVRSITVPLEPVQKGDVVATERLFNPTNAVDYRC